MLPFSVSAQLFPTSNGWIDTLGNEIKCPSCDSTFYSNDDIAVYQKNGKFGTFKKATNTFSEPIYDKLNTFNEGFSTALLQKQWYVISSESETLIELKCHYAYEFSEGLAKIQLGNRFGFINTKGEITIPVSYYGAYSFHNGLARVFKNYKWGFIKPNNQVAIDFIFDYALDFSEELASVMIISSKKENWGIVNKSGNMILMFENQFIFPYSEGVALFRAGDYFSGTLKFLDKNGKVNHTISNLDAFPYQNQLACALGENGKWGYYNHSWELIIPCKYDWPADFISGLAYVSLNGKKQYIDTKGTIIWQEQ